MSVRNYRHRRGNIVKLHDFSTLKLCNINRKKVFPVKTKALARNMLYL